MKNTSQSSRFLFLTTSIVYLLIGIEILIMISPFALYFYSVYGPILQFLSQSPLTAWTTEFFLPHMVFPDDPIIVGIGYFQLLLVIGLLLFLSAAIPLYYGRFTGKGVVQISFYSKIRHPQYLFLAISGFGLLLYWPRFIILVFYITMLFIYYILARNEEWRMKQEVPGVYEKYMAGTPMFLPGEPGGKIFRFLFGWIQPKWAGLMICYFASLLVGVGLAYGLRQYSVEHIPHTVVDEMTLVSVFPREEAEMRHLYDELRHSDRFMTMLSRHPETNLVYIMPGDFFLTALVTDKNRRFSDEMIERFPEILEWHQHKFRGGLGKFFRIFMTFFKTLGTSDTNYDVERFIFVSVQDNRGETVSASNVFDIGMTRHPTVLADMDAFSFELLDIIETDPTHKWGLMPMPTF